MCLCSLFTPLSTCPDSSPLVSRVLQLGEEIGVEIDEDKGYTYLGGWSAGRARDNLSNDSFAMFAVTLKSEDFRLDRKEIFEARWFEWMPLLTEWRKQGKAFEKKKVTCLDVHEREDRNMISKNVMSGLDIWESGKGHPVKWKAEMQGGKESVKAVWGSLV